MKAAVITAYGGPSSVALAEVPAPALQGDRDVIVALKAAALNHLDLFVTRGLPGVTHQFPHVLGCDGAGVVEAVGSSVTRVRPGDRVLLNPGVWCGHCHWCAMGEESLCRTYRVLGEHVPGTFAEAVRVDDHCVEPVPSGVSWAEAAAFPLATLTAWRMVATRAALKAGEFTLIWGIGGGVALAALAVARHLGGQVIVTSGSDQKLERARALGAELAINYNTGDVVKEVRAATGGRGCDVIVDSVGEATWERSLKCLARGGRLVTCGGTTGPNLAFDVRKLFWHGWSILGSTMGNRREFAEIVARFGRGELRPVVDRVYPLAEARAALERMERGEQFGKIVLEIQR
jgi:NADPH:quinone reductase-like Zn-dependent oxidoreductase